MTAADEVRKERRRASNRKAAKKCRIRKLGEQKQLQQVSVLGTWLIFPWAKWPPFRRRYFQMHFREWKFLYFY